MRNKNGYCVKHYWAKRNIAVVDGFSTKPAYINWIFPILEIEICAQCYKVRNVKEIKK